MQRIENMRLLGTSAPGGAAPAPCLVDAVLRAREEHPDVTEPRAVRKAPPKLFPRPRLERRPAGAGLGRREFVAANGGLGRMLRRLAAGDDPALDAQLRRNPDRLRELSAVVDELLRRV